MMIDVKIDRAVNASATVGNSRVLMHYSKLSPAKGKPHVSPTAAWLPFVHLHLDFSRFERQIVL